MQSELPINLPGTFPTTNDMGLARWGNQVVRAIAQLRDRQVVEARHAALRAANAAASGTKYRHPFQIVMDGLDLYVHVGRLCGAYWQDDGATDVWISARDVQVTWDSSNNLLDDPFGPHATTGKQTLTNGTWGVWVVCGWYEGTQTPLASALSYSSSQLRQWSPNVEPANIVVSSTYNTYSQGPALCANGAPQDGKSAWFIGQVKVTSGAVEHVKQWRKSDISIGLDSLPDDVVTALTDSDNIQVAGPDASGVWDVGEVVP